MPIKNNEDRAGETKMMIVLFVMAQIVYFIATIYQYDLYKGANSNDPIATARLSRGIMLESTVSFMYVVAAIASCSTFIQWFRRAYNNLELRAVPMDYHNSWAAKSWFIPGINFYRPYLMMKELHDKTDKLLKTLGSHADISCKSPYLTKWWTLFLICFFTGRFLDVFIFLKKHTQFSFVAVLITLIVYTVIFIILSVITVRIINNYSAAEKKIPEEL
jgi:hypothetical protein